MSLVTKANIANNNNFILSINPIFIKTKVIYIKLNLIHISTLTQNVIVPVVPSITADLKHQVQVSMFSHWWSSDTWSSIRPESILQRGQITDSQINPPNRWSSFRGVLEKPVHRRNSKENAYD